jgi:hypothetical protein
MKIGLISYVTRVITSATFGEWVTARGPEGLIERRQG